MYCTRISQITDGTSSTLLVGDKSLQPDGLTASQLDDDQGYTVAWDQDIMRNTNKVPNFDHFGQAAANVQFGSLHPTRFQAVFCDDSVHSISYSIDATVFNNLGNIADGNTLPASDDW